MPRLPSSHSSDAAQVAAFICKNNGNILCATVDSHKRLAGTLALQMYPVCDIFLSRAARTVDEHRHGRRGYQPHVVVKLFGGLAVAFYVVGRGALRLATLGP